MYLPIVCLNGFWSYGQKKGPHFLNGWDLLLIIRFDYLFIMGDILRWASIDFYSTTLWDAFGALFAWLWFRYQRSISQDSYKTRGSSKHTYGLERSSDNYTKEIWTNLAFLVGYITGGGFLSLSGSMYRGKSFMLIRYLWKFYPGRSLKNSGSNGQLFIWIGSERSKIELGKSMEYPRIILIGS